MVTASSLRPLSTMFLRSSGSSLGRLTNSTCLWMPFYCLFTKALQKSNVTLVFDRYFPDSTKNVKRMQRAGSSRVHKLTPEMPAPAKPVIISNIKNTIQLNIILVKGPLNSNCYMNATQKHTLTTAGVSDVPVEIVGGVRIDRHDLCSSQTQFLSPLGKYFQCERLCLCIVYVTSYRVDTCTPNPCPWERRSLGRFSPTYCDAATVKYVLDHGTEMYCGPELQLDKTVSLYACILLKRAQITWCTSSMGQWNSTVLTKTVVAFVL